MYSKNIYPIGSLIFQLSYPDGSDAEFIDAINKSAYANAKRINQHILAEDVTILTHVAVVVSDGEVIEASSTKQQVCLTEIGEYLKSAKVNILAVLKREYRSKQAIDYLYQQLGLPYKFSFYPGEKGFYCSELAIKAYPEVFTNHKMSFMDINTGEIVPFWHQYYKNLSKPIPIDEMGSHPSSLFIQNSAFSEIIYL